MDENTKIELERANLKNYILQKENEILLETIGALVKEKEEILTELRNSKKNIVYKVARKSKNIIKRIIRRK